GTAERRQLAVEISPASQLPVSGEAPAPSPNSDGWIARLFGKAERFIPELEPFGKADGPGEFHLLRLQRQKACIGIPGSECGIRRPVCEACFGQADMRLKAGYAHLTQQAGLEHRVRTGKRVHCDLAELEQRD